jgi:copper(I)-binding protein
MTSSFPVTSCLAVVLALTASAKPAPTGPVATEHGWVNEAPPGSKVLGGFLTVVNHRNRAITLRRVESPQFGSVQMHAVRQEDG